mmetsp:Transcript_19672/g.45875  ORF Transcript_19672/g.45875 Transcript_19672/m.45875 type:complete len:953 (-) Transcript_19672:172-3030(-)
MAFSFALLMGRMVDYAAKLVFLVCLARDPRFRSYFVTLAAVHVAVNAHGANFILSSCDCSKRIPCLVYLVLVLFLSVATPLLQVLHIGRYVLSLCTSQSLSRQDSRRTYICVAPIDALVEGTAFALAAVHICMDLSIGKVEPPLNIPSALFQALITVSLLLILMSMALSLVLLDIMLSLTLCREMYLWRDAPAGGGAGDWQSLRGSLVFLMHFSFRAAEVTGRIVLIVTLVVLLRQGALGYLVVSYLTNLAVLAIALPREPTPSRIPAGLRHLGAAALLAWPLLFANIPQFVDMPKHTSAASGASGIVCWLRFLEFAVVAAGILIFVLLEVDLPPWSMPLGSRVDSALFVEDLRALAQRRNILGCGALFLIHYAYVFIRWSLHLWSAQHSSESSRHDQGMKAPIEAEDYWPPAPTLALLLLAAACQHGPTLSFEEAAPDFLPLVHSPEIVGDIPEGEVWTSQPARFEDFEMGRAVGSGEFGKVFQVVHRVTREVYAMKRLSKAQYSKKGMTEKALREIAVLRAAGGHPFVVRLVHALENAREWALVMELCPGGDLQQLLLKEGTPGLHIDLTLKLTAEVALALEHLHSCRIVFRDLKLENVVVDAEGHAKLTDFGLAKQQVHEVASSPDVPYPAFTKTFCGSYGYAAPEVNPRREVHGCAADMYSFGVLLFMLLVGGEVFHLREPPWERRVPPETPGDLRAVVDRLDFDFYWAAHHLLRPSGSSHRVEVDLNGQVVIMSRGGGPQGVRRQQRPRRPPTTPCLPSPTTAVQPEQVRRPPSRPAGFPESSLTDCKEVSRRWKCALDLIRVLTDEQPHLRGTAKSLKEHPFYAEAISDWRKVYPTVWVRQKVQEQLTAMRAERRLPVQAKQLLIQKSKEELLAMWDSSQAKVQFLDSIGEAEMEVLSPPAEGSAGRVDVSTGPPLVRRQGGASSSSAGPQRQRPAHEWYQHYQVP